jgi:hypothetical protein
VNEPLFSRPAVEGETCDERIDVPVPASVKEDAAFVARSKGFKAGGTAAWVRSLIYRELYGELRQYDGGGADRNGRNSAR